MNCPNCNNDFENSSICPSCGIDTILFAKTTYISNRLYNRSLEQIKIRDLSGAIQSLTKSIEFNKMNCNSRNLLGLVYFEIGMVGDALKEWVLSVNYNKSDNLANTYISKVQNDAVKLEKLNESIKIYNEALIYLEQDNDDMAIIRLKKAIEYNPKFIAPQTLLVMVYLYKEDRSKASALVDKILSIDVGNVQALNYLSILGGKRPDTSEKQAPRKEKNASKEKAYPQYKQSNQKSFSDKPYLTGLATFIIGAVCTGVLFWLLVIPASKNELNEMLASSRSTEQSHQQELARKDEEILDIKDELERLKILNEEQSQELDLYYRISRLDMVTQYIAEEQFIEAIQLLESLDTTSFTTEVLQSIEELKGQIYPVLEVQFYEDGLAHFNNQNFILALEYFENSLKYSAEGSFHIDDVNYFLGRIAEEMGDTEKAILHYEWIINNYPRSNHINAVRSRYNSLT